MKVSECITILEISKTICMVDNIEMNERIVYLLILHCWLVNQYQSYKWF